MSSMKNNHFFYHSCYQSGLDIFKAKLILEVANKVFILKKIVNGNFPIVCPLIKAADAHLSLIGKGFNSVSEQSKPGANTSTSLRYLRLSSCPPMTNPTNIILHRFYHHTHWPNCQVP